MKVLVTGASGFIASHMVPTLLKNGFHVVGVDRRPCTLLTPSDKFEFIQKDLADLDDLSGIDYVIHLAFETSIAESITEPVSTTYNNIDLGVKMLQKAKEAGVKKFLYPSTASLYGSQPLPWHEDLPAYPSEPYSLQKYALERFCQYYAENGLETVIFRLFQVFGENQREDQVLAKFYSRKKENKPIPIMETADGDRSKSAKRDWVYVGDIADVFCKALTSDSVGKGEIINVASGRTTSIRDLAEMISDNIEYIPKRSFDLDEHLADVKKVKKLLGWEATTEVKEWLKKYVQTLQEPVSASS